MAWSRRGGNTLSAPRVITFVISLVLVGLALASIYVHLPATLAPVRAHRFGLVVAGYIVLMLGVLLPGV